MNVGDKVKAGQHISRQGHTGAATGTHVHFAVQTKNQNGWAPMTVGLKSPGDYLELPKKRGIMLLSLVGHLTQVIQRMTNSKILDN